MDNLSQPNPNAAFDMMGVDAPKPEFTNTSGINMSELIGEYRLSKAYTEQYTRDFQDLDNLVDGVPVIKEDDAPFVGDTTLAGLVRQIPKSSLKHLPVLSMVVNGTKNSITALVLTYVLKKTSFNDDTFGKGLLSTLQIGMEQALTHGYAPFLAATGQIYKDFGTKLRLLHYSDTSPEPGIQDSNESGYDFVSAHLTPSRVRKILKAAEANPDTTWNVEALKLMLEQGPRPTQYSRYESAPRQNNAGEQMGPTYEMVTRYEVGPEPSLITFCPDLESMPLRVVQSRSKWGYPRVNYLVIDPAALTPFGVSRVRLASPNVNMMNLYYQEIASMMLLNSNPPLFVRGTFLKPPSLMRGGLWQTADPNGEAKLVTMDNGALSQFVPMAEHFAQQLQNIMGGQTQSATAVDQFSKTGPGVRQAQDFLDVNINQITQIAENFLRQYGLVSIDTIMCEQSGDDTIIVDDDTKNAINALQPGTIGDDNKLSINWETLYESVEEWSVEVEVSLSYDEMRDEKRADIQDMQTVLAQNAQNLPGAAEKVGELTDLLLEDKVPTVKTLAESAQEGAAMATPGMVDPRLTQG